MTAQEKHRAFFLSVALAAVFDVKSSEEGRTKISLRRQKQLGKIEMELVKLTETYLPEPSDGNPGGFEKDDLDKASALWDLLNAKILEFYPEETT